VTVFGSRSKITHRSLRVDNAEFSQAVNGQLQTITRTWARVGSRLHDRLATQQPFGKELNRMRTISAVIDIAATPRQVWAVLADLDAYQDWNPFIQSASG
jgi:Polyketide cyclase / dehydrase and lipid transport